MSEISAELNVSIDDGADESEVEAVREAFARAGLAVNVQASYGRKSAGTLPWIVLVTTPGVQAFLVSIGGAGGVAGVAGLRRLITDLYEGRRRTGAAGEILLADNRGPQVILSAQLSDEALEALSKADFSGDDMLRWAPESQRWVSPN